MSFANQPSEQSHTSLKEAAIGYARAGMKVVPLGDKGSEKAKQPRIKDWPRKASDNEQQIAWWWDKYPEANIGMLTGQESGFFVLDVDFKNNGDKSFEKLVSNYGLLPETMEQITGSGRHFLFQCSAPIGNRVNILPGIDIKGDGGQIVAAPSIHPNGVAYKWKSDFDKGRITVAPDWLVELADSNRKGALVEPASTEGDGPVLAGSRNDFIFKSAAQMRREGKKPIETTGEIHELNRTKCWPPLNDAEVELILKSVNDHFRRNRPPLFQFRDYLCFESGLDPTTRHILHAITFYMDENGKPAYPTQERLAMMTGYNEKTICRKLRDAERSGHIVIAKHWGEGQQHPNNVYLLPDRFTR